MLGFRVMVVALGIVGTVCAARAGEGEEGVIVGRLRCEYLENPLGIDANPPRLSWIVESDQRGARQTAYRILVASAPEMLAAEEGDLWDSGKIDSSESVLVAYAGKALACLLSTSPSPRDRNRSRMPSSA